MSNQNNRMIHLSQLEQSNCHHSWFSWSKWWSPTSAFCLAYAEAALLRRIKCDVNTKFTKLSSGAEIRMLHATARSDPEYMSRAPLVLLHGMGSGIGLWFKNIDALAKQQPVFAIDLLGFGRSSRVVFPPNASLTEEKFVHSIEEWRQNEGIGTNMIMLGHSFGGYLAMAYSLKFQHNISHLVLVDPWGMEQRPNNHTGPTGFFGFVARQLSKFNPLAVVRVAGPFGPSLINRFRADLGSYFEDEGEANGMLNWDNMDDVGVHNYNNNESKNDDNMSAARDALNYIYHSNAQYPSGETGFSNLSVPIAFAANPMIARAEGLNTSLPVTFIYGGNSWMLRYPVKQTVKTTAGYRIKVARGPNCYTAVRLIEDCGHHVYAEAASVFNHTVTSEIERVQSAGASDS